MTGGMDTDALKTFIQTHAAGSLPFFVADYFRSCRHHEAELKDVFGGPLISAGGYVG